MVKENVSVVTIARRSSGFLAGAANSGQMDGFILLYCLLLTGITMPLPPKNPYLFTVSSLLLLEQSYFMVS